MTEQDIIDKLPIYKDTGEPFVLCVDKAWAFLNLHLGLCLLEVSIKDHHLVRTWMNEDGTWRDKFYSNPEAAEVDREEAEEEQIRLEAEHKEKYSKK